MRWFLAVVSLLVITLVSTSASIAAPQAGAPDDINGDGAGDLLVGVPLEGVAGQARAGAVNVIFSDGDRLVRAGNVGLTQGAALGSLAQPGDLFGSSVELVDINGDGYADAVIGASGESAGPATNAGAFTVVSGSPQGLDRATAVHYQQGTGGLPDSAELGDFFGFTLASGDFDDDGYGDLVVSAPFEDVNGKVDAGGVTVIPGSATGLDTERSLHLSQAGEVAGLLEAGDFFGWSLATGDFNGDGHDDLAVGVPGEDRGSIEGSGAVNVLYGSPDGLTVQGDKTFSQAGSIKNSPEADDLFGFSVAASDTNCDGHADLLIGVPNEVLGSGGVVAGLVNVLYGSSEGVLRAGNTRLAQGLQGVPGPRDFNQFGAALAAGDFDGDGCGDVAISAHTTDIGGSGSALCADDPDCAAEAGAVIVVYGSDSWPQIDRASRFSQRGPIGGRAEDGDFFGRTLSVVDIDADDRDDLVIGIPREDMRGLADVGQIAVLHGTESGLTANGDYTFSQAGEIVGKREAGDQFGSSLADATS